MGMEYFCCYHSYQKKCKYLTDEEMGRLFRALMDYSENNTVPELEGGVAMAFSFISDDIDRTRAKYQARCELNKVNGKRGGRPKKEPTDEIPDSLEKTERFSENQTVFTETEKSERFFEKPKKPNTNTNTNTSTNTSTKTNTPLYPPEGDGAAPAAVDVFAEYAGDDNALLSALMAFDEMRKKINKPMTDNARRTLCHTLDKLAKDGYDRTERIEESVLHCWHSVYPPGNGKESSSGTAESKSGKDSGDKVASDKWNISGIVL